MLVIATGTIIALLYFGRHILIPLALAIVLSFLLNPVISRLEKLHVRRAPAVLMVLVFCLALVGLIGWSVANQLLDVTSHLMDYRSNLQQKIHSLHSRKNGPIVKASDSFQQLNKELSSPGDTGKNQKGANSSGHPIPVQIAGPTDFLHNLSTILGPLTAPLEMLFFAVIFVGFILIDREDLRNRLIRLGGDGRLTVMTQAIEDAGNRVSRYLLLQFLVNACYGAAFGGFLYLMKVPHPLLWGTLEALLRFVPYVGVWIATAFPMALAAAVFPGWKQVLFILLFFGTLEIIVANVIEPWLYGTHTGVAPFAVLVSAVFWATLWGPMGLILSTPLTVCLVLVGRYVPRMSFLEVLLGDAPALAPEELFYQRLLAMDPDEARNVAESYLKDHTLEQLYDSVLIPALRMTEEDRHSDILGDHSAEFITQSTRELIEDLAAEARHREAEGKPGAEEAERKLSSEGEESSADSPFSGARILCLPAADRADELAAIMLTQLLRKGGNKAATHLSIGSMEHVMEEIAKGGFQIVCVSAMPPFAVGQSRSLCRQLHYRFTELSVVVGLWGFAGGVPRAQQRVGPECTHAVCVTLTDAVLQIRRLCEARHIDQLEKRPSAA